ncbi:hypothetical protein [Methanopyrus kandleri]
MSTEIREVYSKLEWYRQELERVIWLLEEGPDGEVARDAATLLVAAVDELKRARTLVERSLESCEDPCSPEVVYTVAAGMQVCAVVRQVFHLMRMLERLEGIERVSELVGGRTLRDLKELEYLLPPLFEPGADAPDHPYDEEDHRSVELP